MNDNQAFLGLDRPESSDQYEREIPILYWPTSLGFCFLGVCSGRVSVLFST
jgi:hypothetical protein